MGRGWAWTPLLPSDEGISSHTVASLLLQCLHSGCVPCRDSAILLLARLICPPSTSPTPEVPLPRRLSLSKDSCQCLGPQTLLPLLTWHTIEVHYMAVDPPEGCLLPWLSGMDPWGTLGVLSWGWWFVLLGSYQETGKLPVSSLQKSMRT